MHDARERNLLGAWALVISDAVRDGVEAVAGAGGAAPGALVTIAAFPGQSMEDLRRTLGISQPGTLRLVERLTADGLVERRLSPQARSAGLVLTAEGRSLVDRLLAQREETLRSLLAPLDAEERSELARLVEKALWWRAADGRDPRHVCRVCDRGACPRCPVDLGSAASADA